MEPHTDQDFTDNLMRLERHALSLLNALSFLAGLQRDHHEALTRYQNAALAAPQHALAETLQAPEQRLLQPIQR